MTGELKPGGIEEFRRGMEVEDNRGVGKTSLGVTIGGQTSP